MFIEETSVETLSQYLDEIQRINNKTNSVTGAVYRGQSDSRWGISSGLSRSDEVSNGNTLERARQAYRIFDAERHGYHSVVSKNPWDGLILAQHFGLPTRLLDWTLSPMVALFFALDGVRYKRKKISDLTDLERDELKRELPIRNGYVGIPESDAAVYMIPSSYGANSADWLQAEDLPPTVFDKVVAAEKMGYCFIIPDVTNDRIKHQSGVFTVGVNPLDHFPVERAYKINIEKSAIAEIHTQLISLNIGAKSVYGDLEGLCRDLVFTKFSGFNGRFQ